MQQKRHVTVLGKFQSSQCSFSCDKLLTCHLTISAAELYVLFHLDLQCTHASVLCVSVLVIPNPLYFHSVAINSKR